MGGLILCQIRAFFGSKQTIISIDEIVIECTQFSACDTECTNRVSEITRIILFFYIFSTRVSMGYFQLP